MHVAQILRMHLLCNVVEALYIYIYIEREREREREMGVRGSPERDISSPDGDGTGARQISGVARASDALLGYFPQLF